MGAKGASSAAQVIVFVAALGGVARAEWSCAGDGDPHNRLDASGLMALQWVPYAGSAAQLRMGDVADGRGIDIRTMRVALCGRVPTRHGILYYNLGYEPWDIEERANPEAMAWGRMIGAELGFRPISWLTISLGVRKIAFSRGHDEPLEARTIPFEPYASKSMSPDRRLGATLDGDFGAARIIVGLYEGRHDLLPTAAGGFLLTARLRVEPIGPVGVQMSTILDDQFWRRRPRFGLGASVLWAWTPDWTGTAFGVDVPFKWGPFSLAVEYLLSLGTFEEGPSLRPAARLRRQGAWVGVALMVWRPWLELAARYDFFAVTNEPRRRFNAVTAGLTVYAPRRWATFQLAYTHKFHDFDDDLLMLVLSLHGQIAAIQ